MKFILIQVFLGINEKTKDTEFSPKVMKLLGSIKLPKNFDYRKELTEALMEKYGAGIKPKSI